MLGLSFDIIIGTIPSRALLTSGQTLGAKLRSRFSYISVQSEGVVI